MSDHEYVEGEARKTIGGLVTPFIVAGVTVGRDGGAPSGYRSRAQPMRKKCSPLDLD